MYVTPIKPYNSRVCYYKTINSGNCGKATRSAVGKTVENSRKKSEKFQSKNRLKNVICELKIDSDSHFIQIHPTIKHNFRIAVVIYTKHFYTNLSRTKANNV